ncbi:MAG: hypothetical protein HWE25_00860 [Alphaproteobacteria bacterium]|nr:hypothetical protein [Alphaproteobacteria bacterium]
MAGNTRDRGEIPADLGPESLQAVTAFVQEEQAPSNNPLLLVMRRFRGLWVPTLVSGAILGIILAILAYNLVSPSYVSNGLIRLVAKEPKILYADRDDSRLRLYDAFVSAEATYIQSRPVIERGFEILLDKSRDGAPKDMKQKDFADMLTVKKEKGLIAVSAASKDPAMAQRAVRSLLEAYVALHAEQSGSRQSIRARELEVRVLELEAKQRRLSGELLEIGEEYDATSLAKAHLTKVTQLEELDLRVSELTNTLIEMEASGGALDADTGDMEIKRATLLDRAMADMVFERAKRAAELEKLQMRYQDTHPKVATLAASLKVIDEAIETRRRLIATLGKTGAITGADGAEKSQSLAELQALRTKLSNRRQDLSDEAKHLNGKLIKLRRINAEQAEVAGMLGETRRILDQVVLESRNNMPGSIEILSRGSLPDAPASDKRKQIAAAALVAGGFLMIAIVFLKRQLSGVIRYSDDLDAIMTHSPASAVFPSKTQDADLAAFLGDMQMGPVWPNAGTVILSLIRFSDKARFPATRLAELAGEQGYRTLLVMAAEDAGTSDKGFSDQLMKGQAFTASSKGHFDIVTLGSRSMVGGYSLDRAKDWLIKRSADYDLILIYAGHPEHHFSARVLPNLSDATLAIVSPGDSVRAVRRTASRLRNIVPVMTGARAEDPGLQSTTSMQSQLKGKNHEIAA